VALWSGGGREAIRGIVTSADRITKAAKHIIDMVDAQAVGCGLRIPRP